MLPSHIKYLEEVEGLFKNVHEIPLGIKIKLTEAYFSIFHSISHISDSEQKLSYIIEKIESIMPQNYFETNSRLNKYLLKIFGIKNYLIASKILRKIKYKAHV